MNVEGALAGAPTDRRQANRENRTADRPTIGALRRARGLPIPPPTEGLDAAGRLHRNAWSLWTTAVAELRLAGAATCGDLAAAWARDEVARWAGELTLGDVEHMTDDYLGEVLDHGRRPS